MSIYTSIAEYFKGAKEELRKVVWPTKEETTRSTIAVILLSLSVALFFWILDTIFNYAISFFLK